MGNKLSFACGSSDGAHLTFGDGILTLKRKDRLILFRTNSIFIDLSTDQLRQLASAIYNQIAEDILKEHSKPNGGQL